MPVLVTTRSAPTRLVSDPVLTYGVAAVLLIGAFMTLSSRATTAFGAGPAVAEADLFRRAAGLRTAWLGACVITLHRAGQHRALGWVLLLMAANPASDLALSWSSGGRWRALAHLPGTAATAGLGLRLLRRTTPVKARPPCRDPRVE
jgi:hypothetical protein